MWDFVSSLIGQRNAPQRADTQPLGLNSVRELSPFDRGKLEHFFEDPTFFSRRHFRLAILLTACIVAALLILILDRPGEKPTVWNNTIPNILLGIMTSVAAAIVTAFLINWENISRIKGVRDLADDHLLKSVFSTLGHYDYHYEAEKKVEVRYELPDTEHKERPDYFMVEMKFSYYTFIKPREMGRLNFRFHKFTAQPDEVGFAGEQDSATGRPDTDADADGHSSYIDEWVYISDETRLLNIFGGSQADLDSKYCISEVQLNYKEQTASLSKSTVTTGPGVSQSIWTLRFDPIKDADKRLVHLSFKVRYPVEIEGYSYFSVIYPTHMYKLEIDCSQVNTYVDIYWENLLDPRVLAPRPRQRQPARIFVGTSDWVLPHGSVYLARFRKGA